MSFLDSVSWKVATLLIPTHIQFGIMSGGIHHRSTLRLTCVRVHRPGNHRLHAYAITDTLSTGSDGPLWAYADYRLDGVGRLAELAEPDIIKIDPGEPGSIETTWVDNGIPAITLEIGPAKIWNQTLISRTVEYVFRLVDDLHMRANSSSPQLDLSNTYWGTDFSDVIVTKSGWVDMYISVLEDVMQGQSVGTLYNSWGDIIEELNATETGRVLEVRTDPAVELGVSVASILYNATSTDD